MHVAANCGSLDVNSLKGEFRDFFDTREDIESTQLAGDASTRRYFRLFQGNSSRILQWTEPFTREQLEKHPYIRAAELFAELGIPAPKVLATDPSRGWILMEDLGDQTLSMEPTAQRYRTAIDWIGKMICGVAQGESTGHFAQYQGPHFSWAFDFEKLNFEMKHTGTHLVETYLKENSSRFLSLVEFNTVYLANRPRFFCHRDYHCRNLMLHNDTVYVIDFQDARMGPITYDLVSLLWDPYAAISIEDRDAHLKYWRQMLLRYSQSQEAGASVVAKALEEKTKGIYSWKIELERMKLQRLLKAAGSYASFLNTKGRRDYLPWIKPALERSLESLQNLKIFRVLDSSEAELLTLLPRYIEKVQV